MVPRQEEHRSRHGSSRDHAAPRLCLVSLSVLKGDIFSPRAFLNPHLSYSRVLRMAPSFRDPAYVATDSNPQGYSVFQALARGDSRAPRATRPSRRSAVQHGLDIHRMIV
jgi:hypothetical protein